MGETMYHKKRTNVKKKNTASSKYCNRGRMNPFRKHIK
jgi:hypothetical protein